MSIFRKTIEPMTSLDTITQSIRAFAKMISGINGTIAALDTRLVATNDYTKTLANRIAVMNERLLQLEEASAPTQEQRLINAVEKAEAALEEARAFFAARTGEAK